MIVDKSGEYSFIIITPRSTLSRNDNICQGPIYRANRSI